MITRREFKDRQRHVFPVRFIKRLVRITLRWSDDPDEVTCYPLPVVCPWCRGPVIRVHLGRRLELKELACLDCEWRYVAELESNRVHKRLAES